MDFELNEQQSMIYGYGHRLAARHGRDAWRELGMSHCFPEDMWRGCCGLHPWAGSVPYASSLNGNSGPPLLLNLV